jgi:Domain of unknown function (DUF4292)
MLNRSKSSIFLLVILFALGACKTKKSIEQPAQAQVVVSEEELLKSKIIPSLRTADFSYNFLTAKAKVKINREGRDFSLTFNFRMQKDEQIWISVNAIGGIEVARALLNKDSIRLLDRLNKQYIVRDYQFLSEQLNTPIDFYLLQDLLLGNSPKNINYMDASLSNSDYSYQFSGVKDYINYIVEVRKEDVKMVRINLKDANNSQKIVNVNYGDFKLVDGLNFPFLINSTANSEKESLSLNLEYQKVEKVEKLEFPFNVPKKFE